MKKIIYSLLLYSALISCGKEGLGGKATIKGTVKHHSTPIPKAVVYIRYGTKDFPGSNVTHYDASVTANANAEYEFTNLKKGDYYLFGVGFDSSIVKNVVGGIPIEIKNKTETVSMDVPVAE
jgi:hypothetical protein